MVGMSGSLHNVPQTYNEASTAAGETPVHFRTNDQLPVPA